MLATAVGRCRFGGMKYGVAKRTGAAKTPRPISLPPPFHRSLEPERLSADFGATISIRDSIQQGLHNCGFGNTAVHLKTAGPSLR